MSSIKLKHSGGNAVSLHPPTSAPTSSDVQFKLPTADGSAGQVLQTDGSGNLSWVSQPAGGLTNAVQFRLYQDQQQDNAGANEVLTPWEKTDTYSPGQLGTFADPSSGVFTFPSTGIWRIDYNVRVQNTHSSTVKWWKSLISLTTDGGSSFSLASDAPTEANIAEYDVNHTCHIFDVTNVSTHKVRFVVRGEDGYIYYQGDQDQNRTYVTFMKLGDT